MGCSIGSLPFTYLGLPIGCKMNKEKDWKFVKEKFNNKLSGWRAKTLSFGGRVTLINSVLSSLPLYAFSLFRAPSCVIDTLEVVNNGKDTLFWKDKWIGDQPLHITFNRLFHLDSDQDATVSDRLLQEGGNVRPNYNWANRISGRTATELDSLNHLILSFNLTENKCDSWSWVLSNSKVFSSSSLREYIDDRLLPIPACSDKTLINKLVPQKISIFVWRALRNRLPVRLELDKKGIDLDSTRNKYTFGVDFFRWWGSNIPNDLNLKDLLHEKYLLPNNPLQARIWQASIWVCAYKIWQYRNKKIFSNHSRMASVAIQEIQLKSYEWLTNRSRKVNLNWLEWLSKPHAFDDHD
ncbi:uncharacterized protein [Rutidosis leptorrhynchoides]|uniref:uncharacterized protein n=1 Tax=Rutidosis leptorrhynchoides TaxID=125765 RepID=UPI003A9924FB